MGRWRLCGWWRRRFPGFWGRLKGRRLRAGLLCRFWARPSLWLLWWARGQMGARRFWQGAGCRFWLAKQPKLPGLMQGRQGRMLGRQGRGTRF